MSMTPQQFEYVRQLFLRLRDVPVEARGGELAGEDELIRQEVLSLLSADASNDTFLEHDESIVAIASDATQEMRLTALQQPPMSIGPYRLLQQIGEGGHGAVFVAEQKEPMDRRVAVKLIKPGMDSKQVLARFDAERQALAMMDHPSIARVLDGGTTKAGSPYFVMELVKGIPIHEFCEKHDLCLLDRLRLFLQVCRAVHHAHQKGIIHRDLKPSNILVAMGEDEPIAKVIDFGIAKALDTRLTQQTVFTEYGQMIGTLEYMSPEQAEMSAADIDTRSDVYSLGVVFYQLLTSETPISKDKLLSKGMFEIPRLIRETEPATPSSRLTTLRRQRSQQVGVDVEHSKQAHLQVPRGDLDWIAMKALAKDRRRRYDSAIDFARDVQRYVDNEPVAAHPPTIVYRLTKFARKHRAAGVAGVLVMSSLLIGIVGLVFGLQRESAARIRADGHRNQAVFAQRQLAENMYSELLHSAWRAANRHDHQRAERLLDDCLPDLRGWEWSFAKSQIGDQAHTVLRSKGDSSITAINLDHRANRAACVLEDGSVEIWNLSRDQSTHSIDGDVQANVAAFAPSGTRLVVGTSDGKLILFGTQDWMKLSTQRIGLGGIYDVAYSANGKYVAVCTGGGWVAVFEADLRLVAKWQLPARAASLAFVEDSDRIVATGLDGQLYSLQIADDQVSSCFVAEASLLDVAMVSDSRLVVLSAGRALEINARDLGQPPREIIVARGVASAVATTTADATVVGCGDGSLVLRQVDQPQRTLANFGAAVNALVAIGETQVLVSLSDGRLLRKRIDDVRSGWVTPHSQPTGPVKLLPKHGLAIVLDDAGWIRTHDIATGELQSEVRGHQQPVWSASCDEQQTILATVGEDQRLCCWELPTLTRRFESRIDWGVRDVCVAPDASWIAAAPPAVGPQLGQQEGTIGIWNAQTGACHGTLQGHDNWVLKLAVTPDGSKLISACENRTIRIWDPEARKNLNVISPRKKSPAEQIALDRTATTLLLGHRDGWVTLWDINSGNELATWSAFGDAISGMFVTADDRLCVTSRSSELLRVYDIVGKRLLAEFDLQIGYVRRCQTSDDPQVLSLVGQDGQLRWKPITAE